MSDKNVSLEIRAKNLTEAAFRSVSAALKALEGQSSETGKKASLAFSSLEDHLRETATLADRFAGGDQIQRARQYADAVQQVGGASKLTAGEQREVNEAVTAAIAKYQALGQQAPKAMLDLAKATEQVPQKLSLADKAAGLLKSTFGQFTAANLAASAIQNVSAKVGEFISQGKQLPAVEGSFKRLAAGVKQDSGAMLASMQTATRGLVGNFDLMLSANKAMLLQLPVTSDAMGEMAHIATTLGRAMGKDATGSLNEFIEAVGKGSPEVLNNFGIIVKAEEAYKAYAAQLDKGVDTLTASERQMAFFTMAMEKARAKTQELGEQSLTLGEHISSAWASIGNRVSTVVSFWDQKIGETISSWKENMRFIQEVEALGFEEAMARAEERATRLAEANTRLKAATQQTTVAQRNYVQELQRARETMPFFTAEGKRQYDVAVALGVATEELTARFGLSALQQKLYAERLKASEEATKTLAERSGDLVKRIERENQARHENDILLRKSFLELRKWIDEHRRTEPLYAHLRVLDAIGIQVGKMPTLWDRMTQAVLRHADALRNEANKEAQRANEILKIAKERLEQADAEVKDLVRDLDYLARGLGDNAFGNFVADIANITDAFITASEAAERFQKAQTLAGKIGAVAAGVGAVAQATGQGSTLSRVGGGALTGMQLGAGIGSVVPGLGTIAGGAIGAAAGAMVGLVRGLSQLTGYEQRVRAMAQAFDQIRGEAIRAAGGLHNLTEAAALVGINIKGAFDSKDPEFLRNILEDVGRKTAVLSAAMEEYGFTWKDMGERARNAKLAEHFDVLFEKTDLLRHAGIDYNEILKRQATQYSELVQAALRTGTEIPSAMQPVLQDLLEMGLLVDENGQAFTDLSEVSWAKTLTQGFDQVTQAIHELTDALTSGVGGALDSLGRRRVTLPIGFEVEDPPSGFTRPGQYTVEPENSYDRGGYIDRDQVARVHAGELIGPVDFMQRALEGALSRVGQAGGSLVVQLVADGRKLSEVIVPHVPGLVRRYV